MNLEHIQKNSVMFIVFRKVRSYIKCSRKIIITVVDIKNVIIQHAHKSILSSQAHRKTTFHSLPCSKMKTWLSSSWRNTSINDIIPLLVYPYNPAFDFPTSLLLCQSWRLHIIRDELQYGRILSPCVDTQIAAFQNCHPTTLNHDLRDK